jgi:hypothetical protein
VKLALVAEGLLLALGCAPDCLAPLTRASATVCRFLAITGYFSLLFSTIAAAGAYFTLRSGPGSYVPSAVGHIQAFGSLWWLAAAATATARGQQAADSGLPQGSARTGVMVLSWLEFALFVCAVLAVAYDW